MASLRRLLRLFCIGAAAAVLAAAAPAEPQAPTSEFDVPYQIRLSEDGAVVEVSGSYSWALPQTLQAVLLSAPDVRTVWLDSPGGHVQPALQVADLIRARQLDTFVSRRCASSCTIAFLAGRQRSLGPDGRLGFHQFYGPGADQPDVDALLKLTYQKFGLPAAFIARILRTPHTVVWYPTTDELRALKIINATPPVEVAALSGNLQPRLADIVGLLPRVPDDAAVRFAADLGALLATLQDANPEACWAFTHDAPVDSQTALTPPMLAAVAAVKSRLAAAAGPADASTSAAGAPKDAAQRRKVISDLGAELRAQGDEAALVGLRRDADKAAFCPALRTVLLGVLTLPEPQRPLAVRTVLSGL